MINVPDELLENYSKEMLKKRESVEALVNRVVESKLSEILKGQVTLNHKSSFLQKEFHQTIFHMFRSGFVNQQQHTKQYR